jgi:hypothetical protein
MWSPDVDRKDTCTTNGAMSNCLHLLLVLLRTLRLPSRARSTASRSHRSASVTCGPPLTRWGPCVACLVGCNCSSSAWHSPWTSTCIKGHVLVLKYITKGCSIVSVVVQYFVSRAAVMFFVLQVWCWVERSKAAPSEHTCCFWVPVVPHASSDRQSCCALSHRIMDLAHHRLVCMMVFHAGHGPRAPLLPVLTQVVHRPVQGVTGQLPP